MAGSVAERREGHERVSNTSVHVGPDGEIRAVYRKIHMFDVEVGGVEYRESEHSEPADELVLSEMANGVSLGLTICYDLRFPELYRILALRGARVITVPANFTRVTGEAHWEVLLRARAIENQVFVIAPGQGRRPGPEGDSYGNSMIVDPWGEVLARAPMEGDCFIAAELDLARQDEVREKLPSLANRVDAAYKWPEEVTDVMATAANTAPDKRRMILDAAVRVFARQGFHHCRVSDVADEAGVAYGLVYHYFNSKEEILNTLFLERWQIMLDAIGEIDARDIPSRDKLRSVAGFIIDSYRHDPDLMKVIIVEVTRAANSFGALHLDEIRKAYEGIAAIVEDRPRGGLLQVEHPSRVRGHVLLRRDRAAPHRLDLRGPATHRRGVRGRQGPHRGGDLRRPGEWGGECSARVWLNPAPMDNDIVKRLMWGGLLAAVGALTTIVANRIATEIWQRVFKEDPPTD